MTIEQIYTGCLAQGAYYISSAGEAAIIDPLREVQPYLERAAREGAQIRYIFETHFHADFVSGHLDLQRHTGASIVYGPGAKPAFDATIARDGQEFRLGNVMIKVLHTPGHTLESSCYLLCDGEGRELALFSGDTLFLGDVGRPDLAQKAASMTQEELAGMLYDSLQQKIMPLPNEVTVYPAHGAGSACGKHMMKETQDSLGNQKKINYALNQPDKDSFVKAVTDGLLPPPGYFGMNVAMNKQGYHSFNEVLARGLKPLTVEEVETAVAKGATLLDVRNAAIFHKAFIPGSLNIGLKGDFAPWVGALIVDVRKSIVLLTGDGEEEEAVTRLARVGFDHVAGYLKGGIEAWQKAGKPIDSIERISAETFLQAFEPGISTVIDVRKDSEYAAEHVADAYSRPLASISEWVGTLKSAETFYLHCAGGYRSMIAASILKSHGIHHFKEIEGGFQRLAEAGVPKTDFVCQSKLLHA